MNCNHCGKENRPEARFCRFCGEAIVSEQRRQGLIGKASVEQELDRIDHKVKVLKSLAPGGSRIGFDCLVLGDSGSGKSFIAHLIADKLVASGVSKLPPKEVDAADWSDFSKDFEKSVSALRDGILLITNAQKLLPTSRASQVNQLDKLFSRMRNAEGAPIVLLCGNLNDLSGFLENNKDIHRLFEHTLRLDPFRIEDLSALTLDLLERKYHVEVSPGLPGKLAVHFAWYLRQSDLGHTNGHLAEKVAETLFLRAMDRGGGIVEQRDIDDRECFIPKSEEEIFAEMDRFVGLQSVKDELRAIVNNVKKRKKKGVRDKLLKDHFIFTGNPGTGKTTFARKFGEVLGAIGALPTGQFVEVSGKDFIGQYVGDTEANVKRLVDKAMGGVLFIDEAYALCDDEKGGSFGKDAVNTLLTLLENRRGEFVCILAGYTREMGEFVRMNPGIPSRCNVTVEFPDYSARELEQLFRMMLRRNDEDTVFTLDPRAEEMLPRVFDRMYLKRTDTFGNAREVRNLFDLAVKRHRARKAEDDVLSYADIAGEDNTRELSVEDIVKELDSFVGMQSVKDAVRRIAQQIAVQKRMVEMGEAGEGLTKYNFILTGNPGTGKTSVARIFGKIFKALGVTSTDQVVQKEPKDIISQYKNGSARIMDAAITQAMGGVLFIDEAYGLYPVDSAGHCTSTEGEEALRVLMTRMEKEAGKFVVICAGYARQMNDFMDANPGLRSRFTHHIHIDDYTAEELLEIYERAARTRKYSFSLADETVRMKALNMFRNILARKDDKFANGREAIRKVEETKTNINVRIQQVPFDQWTPELLHTALSEDIPYEEPEKVSVDECLAELNGLVGLEGVKSSLTKLAHTINNEIESARLENRQPQIPLGHYLFLGNPGTGKTTVARLMGRILYSMGALPTPNVVEVGIAELKGRWLGDSEAITKHTIDSAMGGILFIDEAYQLAGDQYGNSILDVLLPRLENDRGKFVCIAAGYTFEMQAFLEQNSGFKSRFPERNHIIFEDYTPGQLFQIFMIYARKGGYLLDPMAENAVRGKLTMMYRNRDRHFGNGRDARNLFDEVKGNLAARLAEDGQTHTPEERKTIMMEDVL